MMTKQKKRKTTNSNKPRRLGYIRTSTDRQSPARQIRGLESVCDAVFIEEGVSACSNHRPVYDQLIATLRPGDALVVWDVDRAYRSVFDALTEVKKLNARGVQFEAMSGEYDLTTPDGGFTFTLRAALSEWEREKLRARTREGLAAARAKGVQLGRPRKLTDSMVESAKRKLENGTTQKHLADELGVAQRTLSRALTR